MCAPAKKASRKSQPVQKAAPAKKATRQPQRGEKVVPVRCQPLRNAKGCSGIVSIDELHLGEYTLLLCTDPLSDRVIGYSLVRVNDRPHMRRFLRMLQYWGLDARVVVTDGSNLYPATLAEIW